MNDKSLFIEGTLLAFVGYWWFFVATNVNPILGDIYKGLTLLAAFVLMLEYSWGKISVPLMRNQTNSWFTVIVASLVAYIVLIFGGQLIVNLITDTVGLSITQLLKSLASTTAPVFSQSRLINAISFIVMVSFIETQGIFVRLFDLLVTFVNRVFKTNLEINKENLFKFSMWVIIFIISFGFLLLHSAAKGIENSAALILVFIMAVISLILVCIFREARPAILFHIIANFFGWYQFAIVNTI